MTPENAFGRQSPRRVSARANDLILGFRVVGTWLAECDFLATLAERLPARRTSSDGLDGAETRLDAEEVVEDVGDAGDFGFVDAEEGDRGGAELLAFEVDDAVRQEE